MITAYGFILKHRLRTAKGLLKHYWPSYVGFLLLAAYLANRLIVINSQGGFSWPLTSTYRPYLLGACVLLNGYRLLLKQTPVIRINAATLHHVYHTTHFKWILLVEYLWTSVKNILAALALATIISGFRQPSFITYAALLSMYLNIGVWSAWLRYHSRGRLYRATLVIYLITSAGVLFPNVIVGLVIVAFGGLITSYVSYRQTRLDLARYFTDVLMHDQTISYASQYNLAKMQQTVAEHAANRPRKLLLYHLPLRKSNALLLKCCISTLRISSGIWIILMGILLFGALIYRTSLFSGVPVLGEPAPATSIAILLIITVYANVGELLKQQMRTLLMKQKLGLFLPYEKQQVVTIYVILGSGLNLGITMITGFLMGSHAIYLMLFYLLYSATFALDMYFDATSYKCKRLVETVLRITWILLGLLFVS
jgi:hypothetical protein